MILYDLLTSQPVEGNMKIVECSLLQSKNWLGNLVSQKITKWKSMKYDLMIGYEYTINKKKHEKINDANDYQNFLKNETEVSNNEPINTGKTLVKNEMKDVNIIEKLEKMQFNVPSVKQKKIKKMNLNLWISEDFPLKFKVWFFTHKKKL
jgi:hypothetical protein